jgi:hypothetical protein
MITFVRTATMTAAIALLAGAPSAIAQENHFKVSCQDIGASGAREPVGDREHHAISVAQASCRIESGPWSGAIVTDTETWEWDGTNAVLLSGSAVGRMAGSTGVSVTTSGTLALMMSDGKVTGWTATGKGRWPVASGSAASMAGKTYTWTSKPTAPRQFEIDIAVE